MLLVLASVEHGVSEALDLVLHVQLGSDAVSLDLSSEHIVEDLHVLFGSVRAVLGFDTVVSLELHLLGGSVVSISVALLDELAAVALDLFKPVGGVRNLIGDDLKSLQVTENILDKLHLFIERVGIVEPKDHLTVPHFGVMIVEHGGLDVTNVQVARRLRREPRHDLPHLGIL